MTGSSRDIYGRRPTSRSRGKTDQRIMALQHDPGVLPGAEDLLADAPEGSIAAAVRSFHAGWVISQPVTSRRAYERGLVFLLKDLASRGPAPSTPVDELEGERLLAHLAWRHANGLDHPLELQRAGTQLGRLAQWIDEHTDGDVGWIRDQLRATAAQLGEAAAERQHAPKR